MQRLLSSKFLSKISRNVHQTTSIPSQTFSSNPCHPHQQLCSRFYSHPHSRFSHNVKISHGFFPNPVPKYQFLANTLFKNYQNKGLTTVGGKAGSPLRTPFARRNFYQPPLSFDSRRGWRAAFRRFTTDGVVIGLILTNVAVFLLWRVADRKFMMQNFMISVDNFRSGRVHTLLTSAFSHIDPWHLISNMVGLYFFGMSMGRTFGPEYLLKLYLSGAVVGSVFFLVYHALIAPSLQRKQLWSLDPSRVPGLGASGAVNAVMLLDIFLFPKKTLYFDFIIPVPAILLGIYLIGKDMLRISEGDTQISGSAHLGGATVAAIAWARLRRGQFRF